MQFTRRTFTYLWVTTFYSSGFLFQGITRKPLIPKTNIIPFVKQQRYFTPNIIIPFKHVVLIASYSIQDIINLIIYSIVYTIDGVSLTQSHSVSWLETLNMQSSGLFRVFQSHVSYRNKIIIFLNNGICRAVPLLGLFLGYIYFDIYA